MMKIALLLCGLILFGGGVFATELVYEPINPSFGGNPMNGNFLLNQAEMQNDHKDPALSDRNDPLEDFQQSLTRQILYRLASQIVDQAFGEFGDDLQGGHYEFGNYIIDVNPVEGENITVTIIDTATGGTTSINVPNVF